MNKFTKKLNILLSQEQIDLVNRAVESTGLRMTDVARFGIFELLSDPDASRYRHMRIGRAPSGSIELRLQIPISSAMFKRLEDIAESRAVKTTSLARIAICDFARRNQ